jgi:hypothetical protein
MIDDDAGRNDADSAADTPDGGQQADPDLDPIRRELIADYSEAQREHRSARAPDRAEENKRADVGGARCANRRDEEQAEADQKQPLFAVLVSQLAEDRGENRSAQEKDC